MERIDGLRHAAFLVGTRFAHVLVEEFQDTDPIQTEIFWRLCGEPQGAAADADWRAFRIRPGALFLVGDPKQAIYRFRGADVATYVRAREAFREQDPGCILEISTNFRSCPSVLHFVNDRFEGPLAVGNDQPGFTALNPFQPDRVEGPSVAALDVAVANEEGKATAEEQRDGEAEAVAHPLARDIVEKLQSLRRGANATTPHDLLSQAVDVLRVRPILLQRHGGQAERALANVDLYLSFSRAYAVRGLRAFADAMTAAWTDESRAVEGRPDAQEQSVAPYTMHAAKGLEWPIVVPVNTMSRLRAPEKTVIDRETGRLYFPVFGVAPTGHEVAFENEKAELDRERIRLWYVAATRARGLLIVPRLDVPPARSAWISLVDFSLGPAFLGEPRQLVDSVLGRGEVPGAILVVLARVGRKAVTARGNVRRGRMGERFVHLLDLRADRFEECARLVKDRVQLEQRVEIEPHAVVDVLAIEGEHPGFVHVDPGAA